MENGRNVFALLQEKGYDAAIFTDEVTQHWVSGFPFTDGLVLVTKQETLLITDSRYIEAAQTGVFSDVRAVLPDRNMLAYAAEQLKTQNVKTLCYDGSRTTVSELHRMEKAFEGITMVDVTGLCDGLRKIKSKKEIESIRAAQKITDAAFTHICSVLHKGMTELQVAAELEYFMRKNGADGMAFETITVSGKKSSLPHGVPGDILLTENSFLTMDYGARYNGYCSDMTRTVVIGKADDEMKKVYQTVLQAQLAALDAMHPGATGVEVDEAARSIIRDAGYGAYFGHGTGHSVGLEIHEDPNSSPRSTEAFVPGELQTCEPGIYLPGKYGVRIEDLLLVTENGREILTTSEKSLIEL